MKILYIFFVFEAVREYGYALSEGQGEISPLVFGGFEVKSGHGFMVSLRKNGTHFCGGTIIAAWTILTAAHCVDYKTPESISIVAGTYSLHSGGDYRNATEILIHPGWNRTAKMHDIALIKLNLLYTPSFQIYGIHIAQTYTGGGVFTGVAGWGIPSNGSLYALNTETISNSNCNTQAQPNNTITEYQICTQSPVGQGVCLFDSGGPLMGILLDLPIQVGIISWGLGGCAKGYPEVYTRISAYYPWIFENAW
ncbi:trypsin beta [Folsomia candida]|uniref:trypsin beta n=1 Tax=Folsomia candida TaxID=158441 RepID=UPI000B902C4C|nr:trypsin beta [Folsomia candida]